jgi:APA family basic amino acid/polyamine antiporter
VPRQDAGTLLLVQPTGPKVGLLSLVVSYLNWDTTLSLVVLPPSLHCLCLLGCDIRNPLETGTDVEGQQGGIRTSRVRTAPYQKVGLLKILGLGFGLAVVVGNTIGAGILRAPGDIARALASSWLIMGVWVAGGVYAFLGTISVIELATAIPLAGGFYVYARRAFGEYPGFAAGWCDWLGNCASLAFMSITFGEYAAALVPALSSSIKGVGVFVLLTFSVLHWLGLRLSSKLQELTSLIKAIAFLSLIAACLVFGGKDPNPDSQSATSLGPSAPWPVFLACVVSLQLIISTYDGWYGAIYFAEEDTNPGRNLPRSMIGGVLVIIAIYLLINFAFLYALPLRTFAESKLPAADAVQSIFGARSGQIVTALVLLSLPSSINAVLLMATRIVFAMSRNNLLVGKAAEVNRGGTPAIAMLVSTLASALLVLSGSFEKLIEIAACFYLVSYGLAFSSLFVLRKKEPQMARPNPVWGYPWAPGIALIGAIVLMAGFVISNTMNSIYALGLIAASYPLYALIRAVKDGTLTG